MSQLYIFLVSYLLFSAFSAILLGFREEESEENLIEVAADSFLAQFFIIIIIYYLLNIYNVDEHLFQLIFDSSNFMYMFLPASICRMKAGVDAAKKAAGAASKVVNVVNRGGSLNIRAKYVKVIVREVESDAQDFYSIFLLINGIIWAVLPFWGFYIVPLKTLGSSYIEAFWVFLILLLIEIIAFWFNLKCPSFFIFVRNLRRIPLTRFNSRYLNVFCNHMFLYHFYSDIPYVLDLFRFSIIFIYILLTLLKKERWEIYFNLISGFFLIYFSIRIII